jgi:hypothetical protein
MNTIKFMMQNDLYHVKCLNSIMGEVFSGNYSCDKSLKYLCSRNQLQLKKQLDYNSWTTLLAKVSANFIFLIKLIG